MRRHLLGVIGIVLLVLAAALFPLADGNNQVWPAACLRMGLVLVLLWMAWPEIAKLSRWVGPAAIVVALLLAATVKSFGVLIPVLVALWGLWFVGRLLKPLPKPQAKRTRVSGSSDREVPS